MDEVMFTNKLSEVFEFLLNLQEPITDDTCLQRLQDVLDDKFPNEICPGVSEFIQKACWKVESLEPSVITFILHLAGRMVAKMNVSKVAAHLYQAISDKELWKNSSVGTAYFDSLSTVAKTSHGLKWLLHEKSDSLLEALSSLEENTSLFLHTSARRLLTTVFENKDQANTNSVSLSQDSLTISYRRVHQDFSRELKEAAASPGSSLSVYFQNLMSLLSSSDCLLQQVEEEQGEGEELQREREEKVHKHLLKLCLTGQRGSGTVCDDLLLGYLKLKHKRGTDIVDTFLRNEFLPLCSNAMKNVDVKKFHKLAVQFHQSFPESGDTPILEHIIMIPFRAALGETQPVGLTPECIHAFESAMISSTVYIQLLLQTTSWMAEKNGDIKDLIRILQCTHPDGDESVHDGLVGSKCPYLVNSRLQLSILEVIYKNINETVPVGSLVEALDVIFKITDGTSTHNGVLEKGMECAIAQLVLLCGWPDEHDHMKSYLHLITSRLERCMVGTQWEHRDTAVELVTKLIAKLQDQPTAVSVLSTTRILVSTWRCILDSDSYVRASAVRFAAKLVSYPHIWEAFLSKLGQTEEEVISQLKEIICTDTEAFPRRAAVLSLLEMYSHRRLSEPVVREILHIMMQAMSDFDWEVKANALDFWQYVLDQKLNQNSVPSYAINLLATGTKRPSDDNSSLVSNLTELNQTGLFGALISGLEDYDQHVCEKSYTILRNLKQKHKVDDLNEHELPKKLKCGKGSRVHSIANGESEGSDTDCLTTVLTILRETDIEEKLAVLSGSVDEYSKNPIALLEDILSEDKEIKEEKFVDCY